MSTHGPIAYPDVEVVLTDTDNVFAVIGAVSRSLRRGGYDEGATEFTNAAMDCGSYDEVLRLVMCTVATS
jgi:hypothetical protein